MAQLLAPFGIALLASLALVPLVRRLSFRVGRVSQPRADRWHRMPTPTLGGIGIYLAFIASLAAGWFFLREVTSLGDALYGQWGFLLGSSLMFLIGLYDEFRPMSPASKLVGQILAATMVIALGFTSTFFTPRIANPILAQLPNILFTYLWLAGITNAINLLDNMDGLAGGISLITACVLAFFFWQAGNLPLLWVALALAGSLLGFLFFNFPPASIFMGDSGSLFLGFTLAVLAIAQQQQASNVLAVLAVPTLVFLLPIVDTALVTFTRLMRGQSPAQGGRDHTSHRLIAFGLSERQTLLVLYGVALSAAVLAAALERMNYWLSLLLAPLLIVSLALLAAYLGGVKVVVEPSPAPRPASRQAIARIMNELTYRRRLLEVVLDFFLVGIAYYLAYLASYGRGMNTTHLQSYLATFPLALAVSYLSFYVFGVYRGVWRYVDLGDLLRYLQAALGAAVLLAAGNYLWGLAGRASASYDLAPPVYLLFAAFLFLSLAASRSSFRLLDRLAQQRARPQGQPVLIAGAGDSGEMALRWILMNPDLNFIPVGLLAEEALLTGRWIHGVEVLGGLDTLERILLAQPPAGVILAGVDPDSPDGRAVIAQCQQHGCWVRILRLGFELVDTQSSPS